MSDLEEKLVKLCDGIRALVDWEAELRESGETDRADEVHAHLLQMIEFAARIEARTRDGLSAKRASLSAIRDTGPGIEDSAAVSALQASIETDGMRLGAAGGRLLN